MDIAAHPDLARLVSLLDDIGDDACEAIGLLPMPALRHSGYSVAPEKSFAFAVSGGDGVHFSLLASEESDPTKWPVVMTVPMNFDAPNLIVGENLREFLALGIRQGYFELEQLTYNLRGTIRLLEQKSETDGSLSKKGASLAAIQRTFDIAPWQDHGQRLAKLQATFPLN